jgi:2-C-methyl-D-erythritol 4-phosphate cytidylyltransferase
MHIAIILASGIGKRMEAGKNKTLITLGGKPIIFYALEIFDKAKDIDGIVLVVGEKDKLFFKQIVKKYKFKKILSIISGGKERQDSSYAGIDFVDSFADKNKQNKANLILLFHNGANPFITQAEISACIAEAKKRGACAVAHKTKDTIREVNAHGISMQVLDRSKLWNMQTPQAIKFTLAKKAFQKANTENFLGTDDVSLVERLGGKVKIIEASKNNFKLTTPLDLELAKIILKKR